MKMEDENIAKIVSNDVLNRAEIDEKITARDEHFFN
jgi:hypothetical protein